ncbi:MAG: hypothetical protein ACI8UC_001653 [Psychromonas sp.]|jgi:hypothetical protein
MSSVIYTNVIDGSGKFIKFDRMSPDKNYELQRVAILLPQSRGVDLLCHDFTFFKRC